MGQLPHGSARTTSAVRRSIQQSQESAQSLAKRYGVNVETVTKWRNRRTSTDAPMGPKPVSTVLTAEQDGGNRRGHFSPTNPTATRRLSLRFAGNAPKHLGPSRSSRVRPCTACSNATALVAYRPRPQRRRKRNLRTTPLATCTWTLPKCIPKKAASGWGGRVPVDTELR